MEKQDPKLSVVVAIVSDTTTGQPGVDLLRENLSRLTADQDRPPPMEIIVPYLNHVAGIDGLAAEFPEVDFVLVEAIDMSGYRGGTREHHDVTRAHGMRRTTGDIVALLEDCARPTPGWASAVVDAHRAHDHAGIGGAIENEVDRPLNWAVYFCDFGKYQNPVPPGPSPFASDANTSYKAADLALVRDVWWDSFREVIVNAALARSGRQVALDPDMLINQNRKDLRLGTALRERWIWGKSYAATRNRTLNLPKRLALAALAPALPFVLFLRLMRTARERGKFFGKFRRAAPLVLLLLVFWSLGEGVGYIVGTRDA